MRGKTIVVEYYGKRFPRVVPLRSGGKVNFHQDRTVLELDEYDALLLLKSNIRMTPEKFEFGIGGVVEDEIEKFEKDEDTGTGEGEQDIEDGEGEGEVEDQSEDGQKQPETAQKNKLKINKGKNRAKGRNR